MQMVQTANRRGLWWLICGALIVIALLGVSAGVALAVVPASTDNQSRLSGLAPVDTPTATVTPPCGLDYTISTSTGSIVPGTQDVGNHCDNCTSYVNLPFKYYLYNGSSYTAHASSNGNLQFIFANTTSASTCLPTPNFDSTIFGYWADLRTDCAGCGIFTSAQGSTPNRIYSIEWRAALVSSGGQVNFEIRLYEGQRAFDIVYGTVADNGASGTVGTEATGSIATQYICHTSGITPGLLLTFTFPQCAVYTPTATRTPPPTATCGPGGSYGVTSGTAQLVPGTTDLGNHCDDCGTTFVLPFSYTLYGYPFTQAYASSNGTLQFASGSSSYFTTCLPGNGFTDTIFAYWDDLRTDGAGGNAGIFTSVQGTAPDRTFIIEWRACLRNGSTPCAGVDTNFEIRLYEGQERFDVVYGATAEQGLYATVGSQREYGPVYTEYECLEGGLTSGLQLIFQSMQCGTSSPTATGTPPTSTPTGSSTATRTPSITRTATSTRTSTPTRTASGTATATSTPNTNTGYAYFAPSSPLTATFGTTFTLDLLVNAGVGNAAAQQSYLTFTNSLLQVVDGGRLRVCHDHYSSS